MGQKGAREMERQGAGGLGGAPRVVVNFLRRAVFSKTPRSAEENLPLRVQVFDGRADEAGGVADVDLAVGAAEVDAKLKRARVAGFALLDEELQHLFLLRSEGDGLETRNVGASRGVFQRGGKSERRVGFVGQSDLESVDHPGIDKGVGIARQPGDHQPGGRVAAEGEGGDGGADQHQNAVNEDARAEETGFAAVERAHGVVADESARPLELGHHRVTGVDAGAATDAFHLQPLADVDAGRADLNATVTIHAVTGGGIAWFPPRFAAPGVVADH